ncbi:MAG TPA: ATP-binding cassette domain-containing protein [Candidatus Binatia bacterium]|nr:ATP-binding cassette domain-containing protein [Candidatus Binatia bacterium]
MKKPAAFELRNVSYSANGKKILESINWRIQPGEHWAILGPNGSGKTTLLKLACGHLWPNAGGVILRKGKELTHLPELRKSIGWVTAGLASEIPAQERVLDTVVSGKFAQIGYVGGWWGQGSGYDYACARRHLKELGSLHLSEQAFGTLSQGEQQKVLIARARMTKPYLIILDEPCAGMDPGARENFLETLIKIGKHNKIPALIYVTHHVEEILPMFAKTLVLLDGKILYAGATRSVLRRDVLEKLYGVSLKVMKRNGRYWPILK